MIARSPDAARQHLSGAVVRRSVCRAVRIAAVALLASTVLAACSGSSGEANDAARPTNREITALLAARAEAVRTHDRGALLAGIDPARRADAYRSAQGAALANLESVPLARWTYTLGPAVRASDAQASVRRTYGASALIVRVTLTYQLRGVDAIPTTHDLWWTLVRHDGRVVVASDSDLADAGGVSWKGPWDYGPLEVVRGRSSLVLGHADNADLLRPIADSVDAAVPGVTGVWGRNWSREVAVVVPSTADERAVALGPAAQVREANIAAVATSDGKEPVTDRVYGQRLVVDAGTVRKLSAAGRRIVLTHEITHIASAAATSDASPRWLVEGFADYVGNLGSGQPVGVAAAELRADVRRGRVPKTLPVDADFDTSSTAAQAYEGSWLACRLVAQRAGQSGLVRLYRLVGASPADSAGAVTAGLRSVLRESPGRFVTRWRAYVARELGR